MLITSACWGRSGTTWPAPPRPARFERSLRESLLPGDADAVSSDPACTWLWRSLREAEAAGRDAGDMLREAVTASPLTGSRHLARVIDARVRRRLKDTVPQPPGSWAGRVPDMGDPDLDRYMADLAAAMDDRTRRIGEHAAADRPAWAIRALGDVPADPARQASWQARAATLGAYRELYGYDADDDAIGPEPGKTSPEARADWHAAFAALGRTEGIDLRGLNDGQLRRRRAMYERETSWAPAFVAEDLRLARLQARTAWENAIREDHETRAATDQDTAGRHRTLAGMWRAMEAKATRIAGILAEAQDTRRQWEALTEPTRQMAIAADLELRRRHPDMPLEPLRSAEPADSPASDPVPPRHEVWVQDTLDGAVHLAREGTTASGDPGREPPPAPDRSEAHGQQALGLTPSAVHDEVPGQVHRIRENARKAQAQIDRVRSTPEYAEDDDVYLGAAWGNLIRRDRDAILQPPRPDIVPASAVLQRAGHREADAEPEAG